MKISDEMLSGFLDNELPPEQMEQVREQLAIDDALLQRLTDMTVVDQQVTQHFDAINHLPLPPAIDELLQQPQTRPNNVVAISRWRRAGQLMNQHIAIAASAALLAGFLLATLLPMTEQHTQWQQVAAALDVQPSGQKVILNNSQSLLPRLTFSDKQQRYCRQYQLTAGTSRSEHIACRTKQGWQLHASVTLPDLAEDNVYRTASGGAVLDDVIDTMIDGQPVSSTDEAQLIERHWQ